MDILSLEEENKGVICSRFLNNNSTEGVLASYEIDIQDFEIGSYYACFQRYDMNPDKIKTATFPTGANRMQALTVTSFNECKEGGLFFIIQEKINQFLILLPLTGEVTTSWLTGFNNSLLLKVGTLGTWQHEDKNVPLLSWVRTDDIYSGCRQVWEQALQHDTINYSTQVREKKVYPEILKYLGWCTWEEYKTNIDESIILDAIDNIEDSSIPIKYILLDDGHLDCKDSYLKSFNPDEQKFPDGWKNILAKRHKDRIRWMGLWLCFNGYWQGIDKDNKLGLMNSHLQQASTGGKLPSNSITDSYAFYDEMIGSNSRAGFDFVKVDDQAENLTLYLGTDSPVECATHNSKALEATSAFHMNGLINCMAHGPVCLFNTKKSAITRCSEDYFAGDLKRARRHLYNSYANMPFLGQTVWGDHDMFHSSDHISSSIMARSKAISGGPIYLSDNPNALDKETIMPLCFDDGLLIRALAPAVPIKSSLFLNPYEDEKPYIAIAPLKNHSVALAAYNLTEPEVTVKGVITANMYGEATCMLDEQWDNPSEGLLLLDVKNKSVKHLVHSEEFVIDGFDDAFYILIPIKYGWGLVGRLDKYLSSATVDILSIDADRLIFHSQEVCNVNLYSKSNELKSTDCVVKKIDENLWNLQLLKKGVITVTN